MYLVAQYLKTPRDPKRTSEPGYVIGTDNMAWDENVNFVRNLSKRDMRENNVILDLLGQQIVKCSVGELVGSSYDTAFAYYYKNYKNYIDRLYEVMGLTIKDEQACSEYKPADPVIEPEVSVGDVTVQS